MTIRTFLNHYGTLPDTIKNIIKSYVIFTPEKKKKLLNAVNLWCNDMKSAYKIYGHISLWDTKYITDMKNMFRLQETFNSVISSWDVSKVTHMNNMFCGAKSFNQPLNNWNVSKVINMRCMFNGATSFNRPLDKWQVNNVINMEEMFQIALSFNQSIINWDVGNVIDMRKMFYGALSFEQPLNNWDVSKVKHMKDMFSGTRTKLSKKPLWYQQYILISCRCERYGMKECCCDPYLVWESI